MGITLNLQRARAGDVHVGQSPLAELVAVLHILAEPDHHPEAWAWTRELGATVDPGVLDELRELSPLWARLRCRLLFPLELPLDQEFSDELARLARLPLDRFVDLCAVGVLGFHGPVPAADELMRDAAAGRAFVADCERRSFGRGALAHALVRSPEQLRERLLAFLVACWDAFFAKEWEAVRQRTEGAVVRLRAALAHGRPADVLAGLSPTAVASADAGRVRFDKLMVDEFTVGPRPLLLIPSVHGWPHLTVKGEEDHPVVVQFAAPDDRAPEQISLRQLGERLAALASPGRMELCRHLLGEPITTSELARRLGMAESQVSRSLRHLRDAGLVESVRDGKYIHHRLATGTVLRLGQDVLVTITR